MVGTSNSAAKRAAKADRRKAIVAAKRKAEAAERTLAGRAARAALFPIRHCMVSGSLFEAGMGTLLLVRGGRVGPVVTGAFLLDALCRGVTEVYVGTIEGKQLEVYLDMLEAAAPLVDIAPEYARKMLRDLVQWSGSLGFQPHRDFTAVERLFGQVDPRACRTEFAFGQDGKPLYLSAPYDPPSLVRRHVEQIRERLGPEGFDYIVASSSPSARRSI